MADSQSAHIGSNPVGTIMNYLFVKDCYVYFDETNNIIKIVGEDGRGKEATDETVKEFGVFLKEYERQKDISKRNYVKHLLIR